MGVLTDIVAMRLHNDCVVITLCVMPYKVDMSKTHYVMSEIQAFYDVTHIVNVVSYTVDDMSYIGHVMSSIKGL